MCVTHHWQAGNRRWVLRCVDPLFSRSQVVDHVRTCRKRRGRAHGELRTAAAVRARHPETSNDFGWPKGSSHYRRIYLVAKTARRWLPPCEPLLVLPLASMLAANPQVVWRLPFGSEHVWQRLGFCFRLGVLGSNVCSRTLQSMFRQLMACSGSCSLQRVGCSPLGPPLVSETSLPLLCRCRLGLLRSGPPISFYCACSGCSCACSACS